MKKFATKNIIPIMDQYIFMLQNSIYIKGIILLFLIALPNLKAFAGNATYITLSNQIARKVQLGVVANNAANSNTIGFEQDDLLFKNVDVKQSAKRANSFVYHKNTYLSGEQGEIKVTNQPLDIAISGEGYFKILAPKGERYTLNGAITINRDYILVNTNGLPFASVDNQPIAIPADTVDVRIAPDGTVFADNQAAGIIGVFVLDDKSKLRKEGKNLNVAFTRDILVENPAIISGALRMSNVSSAVVMTEMVELQRSTGMTNSLLSEMADLERSMMTKFTK
jgi:flagellar basal-body rod protein FlgF